MRRVVAVILAWLLLGSLGHAHASGLPEGMMFIGLKNGVWQIHVMAGGRLQTLAAPSEPRTASYSRNRGAIAYFGADGILYETLLRGGEPRKLFAPADGRTFSQPAYSWTGEQLFIVEFRDGMSAETEIYAMNPDKGESIKQITNQPGGQYEPRGNGTHALLYSSMSCRLGCGRIIQEIWHKDVLTGEARQITLSNTIARQPVPSNDGKWIYFSSNLAGNYHIWTVAEGGGAAKPITQGSVTDISPAVDANGLVYFIRHSQQGSRLMMLDRDMVPTVIPLPPGVTDLRNLEISL